MQEGVIPRRVDFDEAFEMANWAGILMDLQFVCDACDRLLDADQSDAVYDRAMFVAVLIAYARCFKGNEGVRVGLDEHDLEGMGEKNVPTVHRFFIDLRDKHIAHSVSAFKQAVVGVADLGGRLVAVDVTSHMIGVPPQSLADIKEIAKYLMKVTKKRFDDASDRVIAKYADLDEDEARALPLIELKAPRPGQVSQAREGIKRRRRSRGDQANQVPPEPASP